MPIMPEFTIIDRVLNKFDTSREVALQVNEYLVRDWRIQNPVKNLRYNVSEKQL